MAKLSVVQVNEDNVDKTGFFCRMSKMKTEGNQRKLAWVKDRAPEGLRLRLLELPGRGFVEVMPAETCWRPLKADGWDVIHCLWIVGQSKGKGHGRALLELAISEAKKAKRAGICVVTREKHWVTPASFLKKHGFETVDDGPDGFVLMALSFGATKADPKFATNDWTRRLAKHQDGLVVFRTDQCPYLGDATDTVVAVGKELKIPVTIVELKTAADVRRRAPTPYGVYAVVLNGEVISYKYELPKDLKALIRARASA